MDKEGSGFSPGMGVKPFCGFGYFCQENSTVHSGGNLRRTAVLERRGFGADCIEGVPTFRLSVPRELFEIF